jgi:hypothetical protein
MLPVALRHQMDQMHVRFEGDSSVAIQFGGCGGKLPNCLPTKPGWNYMVRLYRPRPQILDGSWKFPVAHPVQ